jgi:hypothetical protein
MSTPIAAGTLRPTRTETHTLQVDSVGLVEVTVQDRDRTRPFLLLHGGGGVMTMAGFADLLADLVQRGQDSQVFGRHLPAGILSQVAFAAVLSIAENDLSNGSLGARAATITSLLILGVPEPRAKALVGDRP